MVTWLEMCFVWHAGDGLWRRLHPLGSTENRRLQRRTRPSSSIRVPFVTLASPSSARGSGFEGLCTFNLYYFRVLECLLISQSEQESGGRARGSELG